MSSRLWSHEYASITINSRGYAACKFMMSHNSLLASYCVRAILWSPVDQANKNVGSNDNTVLKWCDMSIMASKITSNSLVCAKDCSGQQQNIKALHNKWMDSPHKGPVMQKNFHAMMLSFMQDNQQNLWRRIMCLYDDFDFFYSIITFSYSKYFEHSYTVDVVFTFSY